MNLEIKFVIGIILFIISEVAYIYDIKDSHSRNIYHIHIIFESRVFIVLKFCNFGIK